VCIFEIQEKPNKKTGLNQGKNEQVSVRFSGPVRALMEAYAKVITLPKICMFLFVDLLLDQVGKL